MNEAECSLPSLSCGTDCDGQTLVVEVRHDVPHPRAFFTNEIFDRHFDVVEFDERRSCRDLAANFQSSHADAWVAFQGHYKH